MWFRIVGPDKSPRTRRTARMSKSRFPSLPLVGTGPLLALFIIVVAFAAASVWYSFAQIRTLRAHTGSVEHNYRVLLAGATVLSLVKDAETGQRGFVLTGDETYLEPYNAATAGMKGVLAELAALVSANPRQSSRVAEAQSLIDDKLAELESIISLRRKGDSAAALSMIRTDRGQRLMDELREVMADINRTEDQLLQERAAMIEPAVRGMGIVIVVRSGFLVLAVAAVLLLNTALSRRRTELARAHDLLATTLTSIGDGVIVTDPGGDVTFLNAEAERLTGWKSAEAAGHPLPEVFRIINEESRRPVENPVEKVLRLGTVVGLANHTILIARNGSETPIDDSAAPIREPGTDGPLQGVVLVFRDFSEHKTMQARLMEHQRALEERVRQRTGEVERAERAAAHSQRMAAVGTLASGLAHDINNILFAFSGRIDRVLADTRLAGESRSELTVIVALLDHLRQMSRNLSLFARDPAHEGVEGRTRLDRWMQSVQALMEGSLKPRPDEPHFFIRMDWDVPEALPPARIAPHRLTQIVLNLVQNSRAAVLARAGAALKGGQIGRIGIQASHRPERGELLLSVSDDGCGMDAEVKRRSVEPFFTTRNRPDSPGGVGSGIGLSLAVATVERIGGRFEIDSTPGKGTTITLTLPAAKDSADSESSA